jgi:hypothetical protein
MRRRTAVPASYAQQFKRATLAVLLTINCTCCFKNPCSSSWHWRQVDPSGSASGPKSTVPLGLDVLVCNGYRYVVHLYGQTPFKALVKAIGTNYQIYLLLRYNTLTGMQPRSISEEGLVECCYRITPSKHVPRHQSAQTCTTPSRIVPSSS